jgi:hypothetical protein
MAIVIHHSKYLNNPVEQGYRVGKRITPLHAQFIVVSGVLDNHEDGSHAHDL